MTQLVGVLFNKAKKFTYLTLLALFSFTAILTPQPASASAEVKAKNEAAMTSITQTVNDFWTFIEASAYDASDKFYSDLAENLKTTESKLEQAANDFSTEGQSQATATAVSDMKASAFQLKDAFGAMRIANETNDARAYDQAYLDVDTAITNYNATLDAYNKSEYLFSEGEYTLIYWSAAVATAILAAASFAWAITKNKKDAAKSKIAKDLKEQRMRIAKDSLWPIGGAVVTLLTYYFPIGGTYFIAWGAILLGLAFYIRSIYVYYLMVKNAKSAQ